MGEPLALPSWISKRDGRLVPFEADKICRALFAVTEALGRPDAFLARELTDGVLHFLPAELSDSSPPTTAGVAELVAKVVRELGHPTIAQRFASFVKPARTARMPAGRPGGTRPPLTPPAAPVADWLRDGPTPAHLTALVAGSCLREFSLREVFPRDLVAAHTEGLLSLTGLETPLELAACVLGPGVHPPVGLGVIESVRQARGCAGQLIAIDGPEYALLPLAGDEDRLAAEYARELSAALEATGLTAVVNLNGRTPPSWASDLAEGPLFAPLRRPPDDERRRRLADALLAELLAPQGSEDDEEGSLHRPAAMRVAWHLAEADFETATLPGLARLARRALEGAPLEFRFDRAKRPIALAEGLDRRHPAVLAVVGVHLPRLAEQLGAVGPDVERFLSKLGILARLAKSAGHVKQDYLRKYGRPAALRGFLLERARLLVVPVGLGAVVETLAGRGVCPPGAGLDLARQIVQRLRTALTEDRPRYLDTAVESPFAPLRSATEAEGEAGFTAWDADTPGRQQLRAASALSAAADGGTVELLWTPERPPTVEEAVGLIRSAWQQTEVVRLRFRPPPPQRQLLADWSANPLPR
jgi:hypothetical protein